MKGKGFLPVGVRFSLRAVVLSLSLIGLASQSQAQVFGLTNANSFALVNPSSSAGMFNWSVANTPTTYQNELNQQWFWYRAGGMTSELPINTISAPSVTQIDAATLLTSYIGSGFNMAVKYSLNPSAGFSSGLSDIGEQITVNNTSGAPLSFHFFQYSDFNMGGDGANDSIFLSRNDLTLKFNQSDQFDGANVVEVVATPNANHAEADLVPNTLNKLNDLLPTTLDDSKTNAGPGDVAWAFEWDVTIGVGGSFTLSKDKSMSIPFTPEPSVFALVPLGLGACAYFRRRRQRA